VGVKIRSREERERIPLIKTGKQERQSFLGARAKSERDRERESKYGAEKKEREGGRLPSRQAEQTREKQERERENHQQYLIQIRPSKKER
jgi:hypothetical protein